MVIVTCDGIVVETENLDKRHCKHVYPSLSPNHAFFTPPNEKLLNTNCSSVIVANYL